MNPHTTIYTTAPKDYDYWYTQEAKAKFAIDSKGRSIREVHIDSQAHAEIQVARYQSAMIYMAVDKVEIEKLLSYKLVTK